MEIFNPNLLFLSLFFCGLLITDVKNDSNLLSSDHEVISDVLQEELGPAVHDIRFPPKPSGPVSSDGSTIDEPELSSVCCFK